MFFITLFYLTANVFSSHMHLFIQNNLASVLPRTAKHLPMIHVCTVHRAGIRPDPNYCTGRKWERERKKNSNQVRWSSGQYCSCISPKYLAHRSCYIWLQRYNWFTSFMIYIKLIGLHSPECTTAPTSAPSIHIYCVRSFKKEKKSYTN